MWCIILSHDLKFTRESRIDGEGKRAFGALPDSEIYTTEYVIYKDGIFEAGFGEKVAFSWPSVDRFGKFLGGLMTLGQVKSVPNCC